MIGLFCLLILVCLYFLPAIIAGQRQHKNTAPIFFSNLFFGWTGIGWLFCFIWSLTSNVYQPNY